MNKSQWEILEKLIGEVGIACIISGLADFCSMQDKDISMQERYDRKFWSEAIEDVEYTRYAEYTKQLADTLRL